MHIIQKNIIELELPAHEDGFAWQERLARFCEEKMNALLDALFERIDTGNATIEIAEIRIDLGAIQGNNFEKAFLEAAKTAIVRELGIQMAEKSQEFHINSGSPEGMQHPDIRLFAYFLGHGVFPWWSGVRSVGEIEERITRYLATADREYARSVFAGVFKPESARRRFIRQFSAAFQMDFLQYFNANYTAAFQFLHAVFAEINQLTFQAKTVDEIAETVKIRLYEAVLADRKIDLNTLILNIYADTNIAGLMRAKGTPAAGHTLPEKVINAIGAASRQYSDAAPNLDIEFLKEHITNHVPASSDQTEKVGANAAEIDGIYIGNAGLVLLAPFLSEYLKACGAIENDELTDPNLAVHAIQYLATGQQCNTENELVLNKILCGIPLDTEVLREVELPEAVRDEANKLIEAVIFYWDVLKDTSVAGLQNSFLQRGGKISVRDDGDWLLQVEQAGYDMLLAHLPWTYSIIKLPVMTRTLWVEWA
ncbi:MAG: contractile injection system tape measure protein [Dyadobacter fermentans]